jgi:putative hydrolase of the HAD superfamily
MPLVQAVFFDLDGTLIDDDTAYRRALLRAAEEASDLNPGLDAGLLVKAYDDLATAMPPTGLENVDGRRRFLWRKTFASFGLNDASLVNQTTNRYSTYRLEYGNAYPDAEQVLEGLLGRVRLAVITNGPDAGQRKKLAFNDIDHYFQLIAVSGDVGLAKPDARIFEHALQGLGVPAEATWHVGDGLETDIAGAKAAGLTAVWLNRDGRRRAKDAVAPDYEIASLTELPALIDLSGTLS